MISIVFDHAKRMRKHAFAGRNTQQTVDQLIAAYFNLTQDF